jgi:hypothetical protein
MNLRRNNMTKKIDTTIEVQQTETTNFGPLFDGEDISETELMGGEQPEKEKEAVPDAQESKKDETIAPLEAQPNPLSEDRRCDCCWRHISELKPFGGPGDPLVGDFTGALLVKGWRSAGTYNEEAENAMAEAARCYEADGFDDILDWMINKYGKEKAEAMYWALQAHGCVGSSWECRDCMVLDMDEYFEKLEQSNE